MRLFCATLLLLCGCAVAPKPPMPPGMAYAVPRAALAEEVVSAPITQASITWSWDNYPTTRTNTIGIPYPTIPDNWYTGLEASTNLHDWYCVGEWPYRDSVPTITVILTNRPKDEFYRAYNRAQ